jgi:SAM-dependent methyltransferase
VKEAGAKILVDTSVLAGHILNSTGQIFGLLDDSPPVRNAWWLRRRCQHGQLVPRHDPDDRDGRCACCGKVVGANGACVPCRDGEPLKRALDLGAGDGQRHWDGYQTITTDLRPDVGADFVMDTRKLNFPDDEFDLVASSHHLEHLGRFEQEAVWREMARVLKPGGRMEHVVPNLQWAGRKLANGEDDADTLNVLYGAQETHGYDRDLNTHYFGYTPAIARAMAEEVAELEGVEVRTYEDDETLGYNLIVTGTKPARAGE